MQERKSYSRGQHASVYEISSQERLWFPHADLVRLDRPMIVGNVQDHKTSFAKLFYEHKIAQILFPDNFINVVAARVEAWEGLYGDGALIISTKTQENDRLVKSRRSILYSQKADIPVEHSIFSRHMEVPFDRRQGKVSSCECDNCVPHRTFHLSSALADKAEEVSIPMRKIGISPDYLGDPSDYCLTREGNIVFFEIEFFHNKALGEYLSSLENPNAREKKALMLINRYNKIA